MTRPEPAWKAVACPTCDADPGQPCGRDVYGAPWLFVRTKPHAARVRRAQQPATETPR